MKQKHLKGNLFDFGRAIKVLKRGGIVCRLGKKHFIGPKSNHGIDISCLMGPKVRYIDGLDILSNDWYEIIFIK